MEFAMEKRKFHMIASILIAAVFSFCRYDKGEGLLILLLSMALVFYLFLTIRSSIGTIKKDSYFLLGMILLLGLSSFITDNKDIQTTNNLGIFLLTSVTVIHNYYFDNNWSLTKYLGMIVKSFFNIIPLTFLPVKEFRELINYKKIEQNGDNAAVAKKETGYYVFVGLVASIPIVLILVFLLASADAVFGKIVSTIFVEIIDFNITNVFQIVVLFLLGLVLSYSGIRVMEQKQVPDYDGKNKYFEEVIAITVLSVISILYLVFSVIQILYLFIGDFRLPEGYTYAKYAREGFFQLLFVCLLNLLIVLFVLKHFRRGIITKILLTVISACTYIMIASSALRMGMYVSEYNLTRQRVKVFWALATLAIIFIFVVINIYKENFRLSRWAMIAFCICYLVLSFGRMDAFIARYNLSKLTNEEMELLDAYGEDYIYFEENYKNREKEYQMELWKKMDYDLDAMYDEYAELKSIRELVWSHRYEYTLSADAIPALEDTSHIFVLKYKDENFIKKYGISDLSFRHLNLSKIMARRYIEN